MTTFAGNTSVGNADGLTATFNSPFSIAVDATLNVYVADDLNGSVRKISPSGVTSTIAATFDHTAGVTIDSAGNLYVADQSQMIYKISNGTTTAFAGINGTTGNFNGAALSSTFYNPYHMVFANNVTLFVSDFKNNMIRKISFQ